MSRITDLPRRCWESLYDEQFVDDLTNLLRSPTGTMRFRQVQAAALAEIGQCGGGFLSIFAGGGKAQSCDTPVLTSNRGWVLAGEVVPGDELFGSSGHPTKVLDVYPQGPKQLYEVRFSDNTSLEVCDEHLWTVRLKDNPNKGFVVRSTQQMIDAGVHCNYRQGPGWKRKRYELPPQAPLAMPRADLPLDPYLLGCWLGDGSSNSAELTSMDQEILAAFDAHFERGKKCGPTGRAVTVSWIHGLKTALRELNLVNNKHVPDQYLYSSVDQRLALLQGLMDTDGTAGTRTKELSFSNTNRKLVDAVEWLVRSLGGVVHTHLRTHHQKAFPESKPAWNVEMHLPEGFVPFRLPRKIEQISAKRIKPGRRISEIVESRIADAVCFTVDAPDHLYCAGEDLILTHNTLVSALCPVVLQAKRAVVVVPANLRDKTRREFDELRLHFNIPAITVVSYSFLSSEKNAKWLLIHQPDLLIFDEAHKLKTASGGSTSQGYKKKKAAVAVRISRYLSLFPDTKVVAMTGTIAKDSILDYAHLMTWALKGKSPLPETKEAQEVWAACLDVRKPGFDDFRPSFSVLWKDLGRVETLEEAREAYAERLRATPGVIVSTDGYTGVPLRIEPTYAPELDELHDQIETLQQSWVCPDGWPLGDSAAQVWMTMRMLSRGFYPKHVPWPPKPWMDARLAWTKYVAFVCESEGSEWDTEKQVRTSCENGELFSEDYDRWREIEPTHKFHREVEWLSDRVVEFIVEDVLRKFAGGGGIVWTVHSELAQRLSKRTGWAYFGEMGRDASKRYIEDAASSEIVIASVDANGTGRNLQKQWWRNYVTCPPPSGPINEQMLARTHRPEQPHDEVRFWYLFACRQDVETFRMAQTEAKYSFQTTKQPFKLLTASVEDPVMGIGPAYDP